VKNKFLIIVFLIICSLLITGGAAARSTSQNPDAQLADHTVIDPAPVKADESPQAPLDNPFILVPTGVNNYDLAAPKLFWFTKPPCIPTAGVSPENDTYHEVISRIAAHGGLVRELYHEEVDPNCGTFRDFNSNIVADDDYVYWVSESLGGVARLSTDANVGDPPELLSSAVSGTSELAQDDDYLYVLSKDGGSLWSIRKSDGYAFIRVTSPGTSPHSVGADGKYVFWITGGQLKMIVRQGSPAFIITMASGVTGYHPEGRRALCVIGGGCTYFEYVFIGQSDQVMRYNILDTSYKPIIYTSSDPSAVVYSLDEDRSNLYIFESRLIDCPGLYCRYQDWLMRMNRGIFPNPEVIYVSPTQTGESQTADQLKIYDKHLFWRELGALKRLPSNASALPLTNMRVTAMEVTQAIQNLDNSVQLIENKRTFVLVHAKTDVNGEIVQGVTAYLYKVDQYDNILEGPLLPVNTVGTYLTVHWNPNRNSLSQNFLFELPWDWTTGTVYLKAFLNPSKYPPQASYTNNNWSLGPLTFQTSPRLAVQFVSFGYDIGNTIYYPRLVDDVFMTYSWIRRVYPLASTPGSMSDPSPGFRPNLWIIWDDGLASRVNQTAAECLQMDADVRNLCASAYTNTLMNAMRFENNIPTNVFMYGMISDAAGWFPRGQACCGQGVSSGPVGQPGSGSWDIDGTYGDWYAGHEIGHTLGRSHPVPASDDPATENIREGCGHSRDDAGYPYVDAQIGPSSGEYAGFDVGDPAFGLPVRVYPPFWRDVMSYCSNQWISDYTYNAMYAYMMAHPSTTQAPVGPQGVAITGNFLSVFGVINPDTDTASIQHISHLNEVYEIPALIPGDYSIRLLDSGGGTLVDYSFTAGQIFDGYGTLDFGQIVDFVNGTAEVQIVDGDSGQVLTSQMISANPPTISNVALQGASEPVTGTVTLAWTASDPDGGSLSFDIFYSDDTVDFQPLQMGVEGSNVQVDTTTLGGTTAGILRVVVSDGVHTSQGDTDPFALASKPPVPRILTPEDGTQIRWGQLLNFSGEAFDYQDGTVSAGNLVWTDGDGGVLGIGELLSITDLPVGSNTITLTATNSDGKSASTSITVVVDDDLSWPGPGLGVHPTQVGWHVGVGTTQNQTLDVYITNTGSGSLDWEASEGASWLTISATEGSAPATLTLTADPSGLEAGTSLTTILTISAPDIGESVDVSVNLSVGDLWSVFDSLPHRILLPVIQR
jgi:hypothetical protein